MRLSTAKIQNSPPQKKTLRLFDGRGLYLEIAPTGSRWWRFKYRFAGKEKRISLGVYPDVGLKKARDRRDEMRKLVADGIDPSVARKQEKLIALDNAAPVAGTPAMPAAARARQSPSPPFIDPPGYGRHRPERTLLYQLVEQHYPTFRELRAAADRPLPDFVQ